MRLLLAEDQPQLLKTLEKRFTKEGFAVDCCNNGEDAYDYITLTDYDVVVMDILMPKLSGLEVTERLRKEKNTTPIILLTALGEVDHKVAGLTKGADDYLSKPFSFDELLARVRALLRRNTSNLIEDEIIIDELLIDCAKRTVKRSGELIPLSSREFNILEFLARNKGLPLSRDQIEQAVWNYDYEGGTNSVDVYIRYIRKKLDDPYEKKYIKTVRGVGYMLRDE